MDRAHLQVLNAVRLALVESPHLGNPELYDRLGNRYAWVRELSPRQFYARFVRRARREVGVKPPRERSLTARHAARKEAKAPAPEQSTRGRKTEPAIRPKTRRASRPQANGWHEVRELFVAFAQEVAGAESDPEIIEAFRRVDAFADRVVRVRGLR